MKRRISLGLALMALLTIIGGSSTAAMPSRSSMLGFKLDLSPPGGYVNSKVLATVNSFPANKLVNITFNGALLCSLTTVSDGTGSCYFRVPATPEGLKIIDANGGGVTGSRGFGVAPRVKLTPNYGPRGTTMDVSLRGFVSTIGVTVKWYNSTQKITIKTLTVSSTGSANFYFKVPSNAVRGSVYKVWAQEWTGKATAASFTVT